MGGGGGGGGGSTVCDRNLCLLGSNVRSGCSVMADSPSMHSLQQVLLSDSA